MKFRPKCESEACVCNSDFAEVRALFGIETSEKSIEQQLES